MNFSNKYEEALSRCKYDLEDRIKNDKILMCGRMDIEIIQELVDKETPKKPLPPKDTFFLHQCPNCKVDFIGSSIDRCQCGQKIDWS